MDFLPDPVQFRGLEYQEIIMTAVREPGSINDNTYLIDAIHEGFSGGYAGSRVKSTFDLK